MRFKMTVIIGALFCASVPAHAGLDTDLQDWWDDLGGSASTTGPTSFEGQAAGYYTLGNIRARTGTRVSTLTSFSLPSVEAGCGGIDLFAGSFSFISEDELIQLSKAIAANAVGYAFDLALETISPVIAETMKDLRSRLQELNLGNINSCEAAKGIVSAVWPKQALARDKICAEIGSSNGVFTDYANARHECGKKSGQDGATSSANARQAETIPDNVNLAWHIIRGERIANNYWLKDDDEMAEIAQTITGTIIMDKGNINHFKSKAIDDKFLEAVLRGGDLDYYKCGDTDDCLSVSETTLTLAQGESFRGRVETAINELIDNVENNTAPSADNIDMVNRTTIPLWRILNVYSAYSGPIVSAETETLIEVVANDLLVQWLSSIVSEVRSLVPSSELNGHSSVQAWVEQVRDIQTAVYQLELSNNQNFQRVLQLVERVEFIEQSLSSRLAGRAGASSGTSNSIPGG